MNCKQKRRDNGKRKTNKHSVRSLVSQIADVKLPTIKDELEGKKVERMIKDFNAAHQEIKRIIENLQEFIGSGGPVSITDEHTKGFVLATREMYHGGKVRRQYEKLRSKEKLTADECYKMIGVLEDAMTVNANEETKQRIKKQVEQIIADDCWDLGLELRNQVIQDLIKVNDLWDYEAKTMLLGKYREVIYSKLAGWRMTLNFYIDLENEIIEKDLGCH